MARDEPLVSVIIPTRNRREYLQQAIGSVLAQSYANFELIVVDDGSTDGTDKVLAAHEDRRVRYSRHERNGRSASRNRGVDMARGPLIAFLDDDDLYLPEKLHMQVRYLTSELRIGAVFSGHLLVTNALAPISERRIWTELPTLDLSESLFNCPLTPSGVMMRRTWFDEVGGFDPSLELAEDTDFFLSLMKARCRMGWVRRILWVRRVHASNSQSDGERYARSHLAVLNKLFADNDLPSQILALRSMAFANSYLVGAFRQYTTGKSVKANRYLCKAIDLDPSLLDNSCERIFRAIIGRAGDYNIADPELYVETVFDNLPDETEVLKRRRSEAMGVAARALFYRTHALGQRRKVLAAFGLALSEDFSWIWNRGVASIVMQAIFGFDLARAVRRWLGLGPGRAWQMPHA